MVWTWLSSIYSYALGGDPYTPIPTTLSRSSSGSSNTPFHSAVSSALSYYTSTSTTPSRSSSVVRATRSPHPTPTTLTPGSTAIPIGRSGSGSQRPRLIGMPSSPLATRLMSYWGTPVQSQSSRTSSIGLHVVHAGGEKPIVEYVLSFLPISMCSVC
jgi:hypothetical protein